LPQTPSELFGIINTRKKEGCIDSMSISATWDLFVVILLVIGIVYGFALQRERIFTSLMSIYMGIVVAGVWGESLFNFFEGKSMLFDSVWIKANTTPSTISIVLFVLVVAIISAKAPIGYMRSWSIVTPIEIVAYSLLNMALFLATIYQMLPIELQEKIILQSRFIGPVLDYYNVLLVAPLILLTLITSRRTSSSSPD